MAIKRRKAWVTIVGNAALFAAGASCLADKADTDLNMDAGSDAMVDLGTDAVVDLGSDATDATRQDLGGIELECFALLGQECDQTRTGCCLGDELLAVCDGMRWQAHDRERRYTDIGAEICSCEPDVTPGVAELNCQPEGVGFIGIARSGMGRPKGRLLRNLVS